MKVLVIQGAGVATHYFSVERTSIRRLAGTPHVRMERPRRMTTDAKR